MAFITPAKDIFSTISNEKNIRQIKDENDAKEGTLPERNIDDFEEQTTFLSSVENKDVEESSSIKYSESKRSSKMDDAYGSPSLFNKQAIFVHPKSDSRNGFKNYKDIRGNTKIYGTDDPKIHEIIQKLKDDPKRKLSFADFAFLKQYDQVPTNRTIVLRRFPFPTYNNLSFAGKGSDDGVDSVKPVSKAVTFFGDKTENDISEIIQIIGYKNYKDLTADLDIIKGVDKGVEDTPLFGSLGRTAQNAVKTFGALTGKGDVDGTGRDRVERMLGKNWENDRRGKENVIHKTKLADVGVGADLKFKLVFEYKLRSWNGVNPRVAMLDLISNIMTLVHTNAEFWGGQNIVLPNHHQFPFIGNEADFYSGNYKGYLSSVIDWFKEPFSSGGGLQSLIDGILSGDFSSIGNLLGKVGSTALDLSAGKSRASVIGMKTLLDSSPVGNYHVTIGNPLDPWLSMGNLVCPSFTIKVDKEIGHNGFPTGITLEADLETATPLDSTGVQGIFANGNRTNRMYMKPIDFFEAAGIVENGGEKFTPEDIKRMEGFIF